jgi:hypothetical protein
MGPVEKAIRSAVHEGDILTTPARSKPFWVGRISAQEIILELGAQRTQTHFKWACVEGIIPFLKQHGRVRIGGCRSSRIVPGTLDGYLKKHVNRDTAGWIAALLERAGAEL